MSEAIPLPPRPSLEQYRNLAKDLKEACKSSDVNAVRDWAARYLEAAARLRGEEITSDARKRIDADAARFDGFWQGFAKSKPDASRCRLTDSQYAVARIHGFTSWPKFARHVEALTRESSGVAQFEAAVDAIVAGDANLLRRLLRENRSLKSARSLREHRSTLLHYVSANGVEDFRQKTPPNIVEITRILLDAGADVNAESDAYGGRSTTLGLTATSVHPEVAGVQIPLLELLIERGALLDGPGGFSNVVGCLHNGRKCAAEFLAERGARLDLEGAAGVGRLDFLMGCFDAASVLKPPATDAQMRAGLAWACEYGRDEVIDLLLKRGMPVDAKLTRGETGLHWAAYDGNASAVRLLLSRGAPVDVIDDSFQGTPLGWCLYAWGGSAKGPSYYEGSDDR